MIADIRAYFDTQIKLVDPNLRAFEDDVFGNNDDQERQFESTYNLIIAELNATRDGNSHADNVSVFLDIYSAEMRDLVGTFDAVYDKALNIKDCLIDTKNYNGQFNDIEFILMQPEEGLDNDNSIKMRLEFNIVRNFTF